MLALIWFYWPISVVLALAFLVAHLYFTATRNGRSAGSGAGLAALGGLSTVLPVIPLAAGLSPGCSDTGSAAFFTANWVPVATLVVVWMASLTGLYRLAGKPPRSTVFWAIGLPSISALAAGLEYPISDGLLNAYCNDTMPGVFTIQVIVAILMAMTLAVSVASWMRRHTFWA